MKKTLLITLAALLMLVPGLYADPVIVTMTSPGIGSFAPTTAGGVYVGAYPLSVNGTPTPLWCDDYNGHITAPDQWQATQHDLNNLTGTKFGNANEYKAAGWILSNLNTLLTTYSIGEIHFALWNIFEPGASGVGANSFFNNDPNIAGLTATALVSGASWTGNLTIYTPVDGSKQEFIGIAPVPEPSSLMLLGSGMIGFAAFARKKIKRG